MNVSDANTKIITIGRDADNTVVLSSPNVSAHHARLTVEAERMVLEDLDSTNGTSVRRVENKTTRAIVSDADSIFLGSAEYVVAEILQLAEQSAGQQARSAAAQSAISTVLGGSGVLGKAVVAAIACVCVLAVLWLVVRSNAEPVADGPRDSRPPANSMVDNTPLEASDSPDTVANVTDAVESDGTRLPSAMAAVETIDVGANHADTEVIAQALYIVLCRETESKSPFRVGTAFAVDGGQIVTSASVIRALRKLTADGFTSPELYSPHLQRSISIQKMHVHSNYAAATQQLDNFVSDSSGSDEGTVAALLNQSQAFDVGVLQRSEELSSGLARQDALPRPGQKLHVAGYPFDVNDPFFDASIPMDMDKLNARADRLKFNGDGTSPALTATVADGEIDQVERSFIGSPILNSQDEVVGVYTQTRTGQGSQTGQFAGTLIQHFSEISFNE